MAAVTSVVRAEQIFLGRIDAVLSPFSLTFSRYEVLALLNFTRKGELPLGKIGARLQVHAASVTNAVDRLEQQGLVRRDAHPSDGRTTLAALTREGRKVVRTATTRMNEVFADLSLSDRELAELFRLLRKVRHAAGDFVEEQPG